MHLPHPWRELRALAHVAVHFDELQLGVWGVNDGRERIWLDARLSQVERRCTLAHELVHLWRGHAGCQDERTERLVEADAARYLLPDPWDVANELVWSGGDLEIAADELWVDEPTLRARLDARHLRPAERAIIVERINRLEVGA
ncbi:ImmA/IrrE family metallo-endopeptidase [Janibacter sp. GS2]|uniref:ImmA/IrrE family metallo-endopeptidase n=1 Tax=Janibacter sp. GS2 TaxID=3442646 RepID=UPI003EC0CB63